MRLASSATMIGGLMLMSLSFSLLATGSGSAATGAGVGATAAMFGRMVEMSGKGGSGGNARSASSLSRTLEMVGTTALPERSVLRIPLLFFLPPSLKISSAAFFTGAEGGVGATGVLAAAVSRCRSRREGFGWSSRRSNTFFFGCLLSLSDGISGYGGVSGGG